jgi:hypothetical protein
LGGSAGSASGASGELTGTVYLAANNNGQLDAGDIGAANVTVVLDGRFDFATVVADNLPLPWALVGDARAEVVVGTCDKADIAIGAQRPR